MYRQNDKNSQLTPVEELIIYALQMLETDKDADRVGGSQTTYFSGAAIALVIGGDWSTYRTRSMNRLIKGMWVEERKVAHLRFFRLTTTGKFWMRNLLSSARSGRQRDFDSDE